VKDLFVVTHAEATHHLDKIVGGWHDSELTPRGLRHAEAAGERLARQIGNRDVEIFTSDLKRATQTAAAIGRRLAQPFVETAALREISYGVAEGRSKGWLDARYTPAPDDCRLDHDGGIEGGETRRDVAARVYPCLEEIVDRACETQIIVTHGFTLSIIVAAWMKVPLDGSGFMSFPAPSGSITHLRQDGFFRNRALVTLGAASHLE
jgi:broad specificity phosphatase PhoE